MADADIPRLARGWIAYVLAPNDSPERDVNFWAMSDAWALAHDNPEQAWLLVLEILRLNQSRWILQLLSAGPLEDLLAKHGAHVIDRVEAEARTDPLFATLLGGVWQNEMSDDIWQRVQRVWDRRGWDGIPKADGPN